MPAIPLDPVPSIRAQPYAPGHVTPKGAPEHLLSYQKLFTPETQSRLRLRSGYDFATIAKRGTPGSVGLADLPLIPSHHEADGSCSSCRLWHSGTKFQGS